MDKRSFSRGCIGIGVILLAAVLLSGCDINFYQDSELGYGYVPITGKWELVGDWGTETWEISSYTISYGDYYVAEIVYVEDGKFNAGDTKMTSAAERAALNPGFAVIRYLYAQNASSGEAGKYNIFRWADNREDEDAKDFTQGGSFTGSWENGDLALVVFDTLQEAIDGATNEEGFFDYSSQGALLGSD